MVYYFANGGRVAKNSDEGMFWYLDDHLGSTNVMIDADGELVERTLYYPFGSHREGGEEKYSFTGKEFDSEIGLYYYGARYYNPETFVFTQADTIIPDVYYPQALNRYSYCYNNPLKYTDPDGHEPITLTTAALIIGACVVVGAVAGAGWSAYSQYQETGDLSQINLRDVGKSAAVGGIAGGAAGVVGVVAVAGIGVSVVGTAVCTADAVAIGLIDAGAVALTAFTAGIFERGATEAVKNGTGNVMEKAFDPTGMLYNLFVNPIPLAPKTGNTVVDISVGIGSSKAIETAANRQLSGSRTGQAVVTDTRTSGGQEAMSKANIVTVQKNQYGKSTSKVTIR